MSRNSADKTGHQIRPWGDPMGPWGGSTLGSPMGVSRRGTGLS